MHLENTMVMYGIYNVETLENLVKMHYMLYTADKHYMKILFAGKTSAAYRILFANAQFMWYSALCS